MSWRNPQTFGEQLISELVAAMRLDQSWIVDTAGGFEWWPSGQKQRVWCDDGLFTNQSTTYRIHSEMDLIRGSGKALQFEVEIEREMDAATMSAVVYDAKDDTYKLHSSVFATEDNIVYLKRTCFAAVILQVREAMIIAERLRSKLNAVVALTEHPSMGMRPSPDPICQAPEHFFCPSGTQESKWRGVMEWRETELAIERESSKFNSDHHTHLTAEFQWSASPSNTGIALEVRTQEPHPLLGNGLHFTLMIPMIMALERISHLALELNQLERDSWKRTHMLGSWCSHDTRLAYRMFIPNVLYRPELMPEFCLQMANRAHWVNDWFMEKRREADKIHNAQQQSQS